MKMFFAFLIVLVHGYGCTMAFAKQTLNLNPTGYASISTASFVTSAVVSQGFGVPAAKMVAVLLYKSGVAEGTAILQGSVDASTWTAFNTTTHPNTTASVNSVATSVYLHADDNPFPYVRYRFTESGTGNGSITGGRISTK